MTVISEIIGLSNFEKVRSQIAALLVSELDNQKSLIEQALLTAPAEEVETLELSLSAIPSKVWEERFKRPMAEEYVNTPIINVMFAQAPLNALQSVSTQSGDNTYIVEVYAGEREPQGHRPEKEGDSLASFKLQRCLAQCRAILMSPYYQHLGFPKPWFIGSVSVNSIQISQPNDGNDNSDNMIYGRFNVNVKMSEGVEQIAGTANAIGETTLKLYDTEKGYYWTNESN